MAVSTFDVIKANTFIGPSMFTTGQVFYVSNSSTIAPGAIGGSNSNSGTSPQQPFSTIVYAITQCTASRGDVIYVLPGHAETVSAAATIAMSKIGVSLIGIGKGALRPTLNWTATASTMTVAGAGCYFENLLFTNGVDAVVSMVVVSAADVEFNNCEWRSVTGDAAVSLLTTAAADRLQVHDCRFTGSANATATAYIALVGGDEIQVYKCRFDGQASAGFIDVRTTAATDLEVHDCTMRSRGTGEVFVKDTITASTGIMGPNIYCRLSANAANVTEAITGATFVVFKPILVVNLANEQGFDINWTTTADL